MKHAVWVAAALCLLGAAAGAKGKGEAEASKAPQELKIWANLWYNTAVSAASLADTPLYKEVEKRTGVKVTWIHPPQGQGTEQFNLMIASQDLPDMIEWEWPNRYPGGPEKAMSDGVIVRLNDLLQKHAPNLTGRYAKHPEWLKASKTDSGALYMFPFIYGHDDLLVWFGPQLRKDWLNELKLQVPETLAEWEKVLTAFKTAGKCEYPLTMTRFSDGRGVNDAGSTFIQPFGTTWRFHQDDAGKVHFGPYDSQFKDFLVFFKGWIDKGLVDPELWSNTRKTFDAKVLNGKAGAWVNATGSGIGAYLDANAGKGTFDIVAARYPVLNKGETPFMGQRDNPLTNQGTAITTKARDPALCARWLDYAYGEEGHLLFNFGIEGQSYAWVTDYPGFEGRRFPKYTDLMNRNPDGKTLAQMGGLYTRSFWYGSIVCDEGYIYQYAWRPSQREAITLWGKTAAEKHMLPPITSTPQESEETAAIGAEVTTYFEEMVVKFITGQEPMENFAAYQARLKQIGVEKLIQTRQAGLDRFKAR